MNDLKKVWFVTGASKGLGLALVKKLLANGYRVAATSRNASELNNAIGNQSASFLPLEVNLKNEQAVSTAIKKAIETFGSIDVVVNNAGYGQMGTLEELSDKEARENFDANVFGSLNVIRSVMPYLRIAKKGWVVNIASIGGLTGDFAGWGIYCATKFAMVGFTEALSAEAQEFGINATVVYPGYFRTNFLSGGSLRNPEKQLQEYTEARKLQALHENDINGNQPGDPGKAADVLIQAAEMGTPPLHLFLGTDAFQTAKNKLAKLKEELVSNEPLSKSTDY